QGESRPVLAGLDLAALAGQPPGLVQGPAEPLRPRRAELNREQALHPDHANRGRVRSPSYTKDRLNLASLPGRPPPTRPWNVAVCWNRDRASRADFLVAGGLPESDVALLALSLLRLAESFDGGLRFCRCVGCRRVADQDVPDTDNKLVRVAHPNPERRGDGTRPVH